MNRLLAAGILIVSAVALAIGPALLSTPEASASTMPITSIEWQGATAKCLAVPKDHAVVGQGLALVACNPSARGQQWVLANDHLRLHGTGLYATVGTDDVIVLARSPGTYSFVYGPTHTIHIDNGWLTWCGPGPVFYYAHWIANCQTWYAFTTLS